MLVTTLLVTTLGAPAAPTPVPAPPRPAEVARGLRWLAGQQTRQGCWEGPAGNTAATTAAAGLALLMEGSTLNEGRYAEHLRRAVAWYEGVAQPNGALVPEGDTGIPFGPLGAHAAGVLFLASALDTDDDEPRRKKLGKVLAAAVGHLVASQTAGGAWATFPGEGGDNTQLTAEVLRALAAARIAGVEVPAGAVQKGTDYCVAATATDGGVAFSRFGVAGQGAPNFSDPYTTSRVAGAFLTGTAKPATFRAWLKSTRDRMPQPPAAGQPATYTSSAQFMGQSLPFARVAHLLGEAGYRKVVPDGPDAPMMRWSVHRARLFKAVVASQSPDGSWADAAEGPALATALALTILQLDNNYLPALAR